MTQRFEVRVIIAMTIALVVWGNSARDAAAADEYPWFPEAFPHHLRVRLSSQEAGLQLASLKVSERWYIDQLKKWDVETPIRVCFFGGSKDLRARIVKIAAAWQSVPGTRVPLDFGDPASPRICKSNEFNHIRVGYNYSGYWSLVGQDSIEQAAQGEQSMNLGRYNVNPPPEPNFTRVVLHEFGHALGFHHEHQNPIGPCQSDFDWPVIESYLKGDPNYWDDETINFNMKTQPGTGDPGAFDVGSIMLYAFPKRFYKHGTKSECFTESNVALSDGDKAGLAKLYPADIDRARMIKQEALAKYSQAIASNASISPENKSAALVQASRLSVPNKSMIFENIWASDSRFVGGSMDRDNWTAGIPPAPRM